ncbi:MAG TPA: DUF5715 family protein [Acidobacteriaceae bacterium]
MTMTQWGLAGSRHDARGRRLSRGAAAVMALGIVVLWLGCSPAAVAHPMQLHRVVGVHKASSVSTSHAKARAVSSAHHARKGTARKALSKGAAVKKSQTRTGSAPRKANVPAGRSDARARLRHPRHPAHVDEHEPPALHRVSASRRYRGHSARLGRSEVAASSTTEETTHSVLPVSSRDNERVVSRPLTVNDFARAASTPAATETSVFASGQSHPDEDVSSVPARVGDTSLKLQPARQTAVLARVEAAPSESEHGSAHHTAPSDLVGEPIQAPERTVRSADAEADSDEAGLRAPSRQELMTEVEQPMVLPGLYRNGRLVVPPPLRGTREILVHQNTMADEEGLQRVEDDADLRHMRATRQLIDFPENASLHLNSNLADNHRCARPWAVRFASDIARAYYARFHEPLQINSAVRTVSYQVRLQRVNGNAAGVRGDVASPHLTGEALDFGKHGMSVQEIAWMRLYLMPLMRGGKLDVEEEFQQACFHISVYRTYLPASKRRSVARREEAQLSEPRVPKTARREDQVQ